MNDETTTLHKPHIQCNTLMMTISPVAAVGGWAQRISHYLQGIGPDWFTSRLGVDFREDNRPLEGATNLLAINIHVDVLAGPALQEVSTMHDGKLQVSFKGERCALFDLSCQTLPNLTHVCHSCMQSRASVL